MKKLSINLTKELSAQVKKIKKQFGLETNAAVFKAGLFVLSVYLEAKELDEKIVMIDKEYNITRELIFEDEEIIGDLN